MHFPPVRRAAFAVHIPLGLALLTAGGAGLWRLLRLPLNWQSALALLGVMAAVVGLPSIILRIAALARRVHMLPDDELDRTFPAQYSTIVEVTTRDGRRFSERVDFARGCPENPVSYAEIARKFAGLTVPTIGRERSERVAKLVTELGALDNVAGLAALLREPGA